MRVIRIASQRPTASMRPRPSRFRSAATRSRCPSRPQKSRPRRWADSPARTPRGSCRRSTRVQSWPRASAGEASPRWRRRAGFRQRCLANPPGLTPPSPVCDLRRPARVVQIDVGAWQTPRPPCGGLGALGPCDDPTSGRTGGCGLPAWSARDRARAGVRSRIRLQSAATRCHGSS